MITKEQAATLQELETIILNSIRTQDYSGCISKLHLRVDQLRQTRKRKHREEFEASQIGKEVIVSEKGKEETHEESS